MFVRQFQVLVRVASWAEWRVELTFSLQDNEHAAIIMQIESAEGVKNVEEICALPEVNAIMVRSFLAERRALLISPLALA